MQGFVFTPILKRVAEGCTLFFPFLSVVAIIHLCIMQCMYIQYIPDALTMLFLQVKDKLHFELQ
jgi:Na+/alanine symporter